MKSIATIIALGLLVSVSHVQVPPHKGFPNDGVVPDGATAAAIAEIVARKAYGSVNIARQLPFIVTYEKGVYTVEGRLKEGVLGGNVTVKLRKKDGAIIFLDHTA